MADNQTLSTLAKIETLLKKLWLANLGIYSRSKEGFLSGYQKFAIESQRFFDELVSKGETIETEAKDQITKEISDQRERIEQRISDLKQKLTYKSSFSAKLDELEEKLEALTKLAAES